MDSSTKIGEVTQLVIMSRDSMENVIETPINKNFIENPNATYANVDIACRALMSLSKNTYFDTICITNLSVSEIMSN